MNTTPLNNTSPKSGSSKKWTRSSIAAAVAAGALTTEVANMLYAQLEPEPAESERISKLESEFEPTPDPVGNSTHTTNNENLSNPYSGSTPNPSVEPVPDPQPEPDPMPEPDPQPDPYPIPEPDPDPIPDPIPEPDPEPINDDDIVDVIVEEIDPQDIDMNDVLLIDEIGTVYTIDGGEINAAIIHDSQGNKAVMVDADGDNVYDVILTPEGEMIAQVPGDIDVSDVELLYAQQHNQSGYMAQNDFDVAMNEEHDNIQDDILLT